MFTFGRAARRGLAVPAWSRLYLAVVGERTDVARGALDAQDTSGLIIHLEAGRPQGVFDPGALHERLEAAADLGAAAAVRAFAEETIDIVAAHLDRGGAHDLLIQVG